MHKLRDGIRMTKIYFYFSASLSATEGMSVYAFLSVAEILPVCLYECILLSIGLNLFFTIKSQEM